MAKSIGRRQLIGGAIGLVGVLGIGVGAHSRAQDASPPAAPSASPAASPAASPIASPSPAPVTIAGFDIGWEYNGKRTTAGSPIEVPVLPGATISLPNIGNALHNFVVDEWGIEVEMPVGETVQATVPADAESGSYKFYCSIPGHEAAGMVGQLAVQ